MISVHLRDIDPGVVAAWGAEFGSEPSVAISCGNIFEQAADAIVSPANSFGFMDGGIDLVYSHHFPYAPFLFPVSARALAACRRGAGQNRSEHHELLSYDDAGQ